MTFAESKLALSAALALSCILAAAGALDPAEPRTWLMLVGCVALLATGIAIGERIAGGRSEQPRTLTQIYLDEAA
ncbi:hypothetical protein [uncultured Methylobacterium sp.]|jgi:hypothetical protein|uniref:hypothetical protein n=1 Tax=uncultured Methylobacterium sp. TaxID=157278 RepID=UPI00260296BC|nr:hypothetical protein [uncultured Methylobacterium sp.]